MNPPILSPVRLLDARMCSGFTLLAADDTAAARLFSQLHALVQFLHTEQSARFPAGLFCVEAACMGYAEGPRVCLRHGLTVHLSLPPETPPKDAGALSAQLCEKALARLHALGAACCPAGSEAWSGGTSGVQLFSRAQRTAALPGGGAIRFAPHQASAQPVNLSAVNAVLRAHAGVRLSVLVFPFMLFSDTCGLYARSEEGSLRDEIPQVGLGGSPTYLLGMPGANQFEISIAPPAGALRRAAQRLSPDTWARDALEDLSEMPRPFLALPTLSGPDANTVRSAALNLLTPLRGSFHSLRVDALDDPDGTLGLRLRHDPWAFAAQAAKTPGGSLSFTAFLLSGEDMEILTRTDEDAPAGDMPHAAPNMETGFEIVREIEQGASARCYLARRLTPDGPGAYCVLKEFCPEVYSRYLLRGADGALALAPPYESLNGMLERLREAFLAEAERCRQVNQAGGENNYPWVLRCERVPGRRDLLCIDTQNGYTIADFVRHHRPHAPDPGYLLTCLLILLRLLDALRGVHRSMLHLDVSPGNVYIVTAEPGRLRPESTFSVKLLDLAAARPKDDFDGGLDPALRPAGTPGFADPALRRADVPVDERMDWYSAAAVLYFMLTGAPCPQSLYVRLPQAGALAHTMLRGEIEAMLARALRRDTPYTPADVEIHAFRQDVCSVIAQLRAMISRPE